MAETPGKTPAARRRWQVTALFAAFFLPVLVASWLNVEHADWLPFGTTNYGELIQPPKRIAATGLYSGSGGPAREGLLRERWTLLMVNDGPCGAACLQLLSDTHRVRRGLGKDMERIRRLVVVTTKAAVPGIEALYGEQPDLELAVARAQWPGIELARFGATAGALFIVDPQGYVVLRYPIDADPRGLTDDLERLLKISKIG